MTGLRRMGKRLVSAWSAAILYMPGACLIGWLGFYLAQGNGSSSESGWCGVYTRAAAAARRAVMSMCLVLCCPYATDGYCEDWHRF